MIIEQERSRCKNVNIMEITRRSRILAWWMEKLRAEAYKIGNGTKLQSAWKSFCSSRKLNRQKNKMKEKNPPHTHTRARERKRRKPREKTTVNTQQQKNKLCPFAALICCCTFIQFIFMLSNANSRDEFLGWNFWTFSRYYLFVCDINWIRLFDIIRTNGAKALMALKCSLNEANNLFLERKMVCGAHR